MRYVLLLSMLFFAACGTSKKLKSLSISDSHDVVYLDGLEIATQTRNGITVSISPRGKENDQQRITVSVTNNSLESIDVLPSKISLDYKDHNGHAKQAKVLPEEEIFFKTSSEPPRRGLAALSVALSGMGAKDGIGQLSSDIRNQNLINKINEKETLYKEELKSRKSLLLKNNSIGKNESTEGDIFFYIPSETESAVLLKGNREYDKNYYLVVAIGKEEFRFKLIGKVDERRTLI